MPPRLPLGMSSLDNVRQLQRRGNRRLCSGIQNCRGNFAGELFVAKLTQHPSQIWMTHIGQPLGSGGPHLGIHAHIQRAVLLKAKTPLGLI